MGKVLDMNNSLYVLAREIVKYSENILIIFICAWFIGTGWLPDIKGPITWSIFNPGVELSPVNRVEIFFDYTWTISTPGLKRYTTRSRHRFAEVKKAFILFSCNK